MRSKKLPSIKKDIKNFLNSEEGKLTKKSALKLGLTLGIIGLITEQTVNAQHNSCWTKDCTSDYTWYGGGGNTNDGGGGDTTVNIGEDGQVYGVYHENNDQCTGDKNVECYPADKPGSNATVNSNEHTFEHGSFDSNECEWDKVGDKGGDNPSHKYGYDGGYRDYHMGGNKDGDYEGYGCMAY